MVTNYKFETKEELISAVDLWVTDESVANLTYGDINTWDVGAITDFSSLFMGREGFNSDISNWDVSNGDHFGAMFLRAHSFNQDISSWDVSSGIYFHSMFQNAYVFNQDLSNWDVGNGTTFYSMFSAAISFNQPIGSWDVRKGTDFAHMFGWAELFNNDVFYWNTTVKPTFDNSGPYANMFYECPLEYKLDEEGQIIYGKSPTIDVFIGQDINGASNSETLIGSSGNDFIYGNAGKDIIHGGDGWDNITGGFGNDTLDGGAKDDTACYTGKKDDYLITEENNILTIQDLRDNSPDGTDSLTNIEFIKFSDQKKVSIEDLNNQEPGPEPDTTAPFINSFTFYVEENVKNAFIFSSDESVTWSLIDAADSSLFTINQDTGLLSFNNEPDYENPLDANKDNKYILGVKATDLADN